MRVDNKLLEFRLSELKNCEKWFEMVREVVIRLKKEIDSDNTIGFVNMNDIIELEKLKIEFRFLANSIGRDLSYLRECIYSKEKTRLDSASMVIQTHSIKQDLFKLSELYNQMCELIDTGRRVELENKKD